jgi:hypothetical protein
MDSTRSTLMMLSGCGAIVFSIALCLGGERRGVEVTVSVHKLFVPANGFNEEEEVRIVLEGELPDPCFVLHDPIVERNSDGRSIRIRLPARRRFDGTCGSGDLIDQPYPFLTDVSLGRLPASDYRLEYDNDERETAFRIFSVRPLSNPEQARLLRGGIKPYLAYAVLWWGAAS